MRLRILLAALLTAVVGAAVAAPASAAPSAQDTSWMAAAHQTNLTEIAAGTAAGKKASSQGVKDAGAMFVSMHTDLDAKLTAAAEKLGVKLPTAPSPAQQKTLASVGAQSGAAFDAAWIASQIAGHREALAGTKKEIASGSDATVVALATTAAPVIQQHLTTVQALAGNPESVQAGTGGQAAVTTSVVDNAGARALLLLGLLGGLTLVMLGARRLRATQSSV